MNFAEGSITRLAGRRECRFCRSKHLPAADTCQSSNRTLLSTIGAILKKGKLFRVVSWGFMLALSSKVSTINANIAKNKVDYYYYMIH